MVKVLWLGWEYPTTAALRNALGVGRVRSNRPHRIGGELWRAPPPTGRDCTANYLLAFRLKGFEFRQQFNELTLCYKSL